MHSNVQTERVCRLGSNGLLVISGVVQRKRRGRLIFLFVFFFLGLWKTELECRQISKILERGTMDPPAAGLWKGGPRKHTNRELV